MPYGSWQRPGSRCRRRSRRWAKGTAINETTLAIGLLRARTSQPSSTAPPSAGRAESVLTDRSLTDDLDFVRSS